MIYCLLLILVVFGQNVSSQRYKTIYQKIQQEKEYSEFKSLIRNNRVALLNLHYEQLTVFVPENSSFKHSHEVNYNSDIAFYHMSFEVKTLGMLNKTNSIPTVILENPPLWITQFDGDIYVNNAKIIQNKSDYSARSRSGDMGKQQVLHVIDSVLNPMVQSPTSSPSAYDFLNSISNWNLGAGKTVGNFLTKVQENKVQYVFKQNAGHTFFVPLDSGIGPFKFNMINKNIIFGHIVPFYVLFTRPTPKKFAYESLANDDTVYIVVSFEEMNKKLFVKGIMRGSLGVGEFYSEIVVPNIPVRNGVVHLISQPLGIYERKLKPFPYLTVLEKLSLDPNTDVFYEMGEKTGFHHIFSRPNVSFTYFVPSDLSWKLAKDSNLERLDTDIQTLGRHLVISHSPYSIEQLVSLTKANNYGDIELSTPVGPLRIMVLLIKGEYYLKWHNRYIKVERPNYECSDGVIHILNSTMANFRRRDVDYKKVEATLGEFVNKVSNIFNSEDLETNIVHALNLL